MNAERWNTRYQASEYVYGTEPNAFVASQVHLLPEGTRIVELGSGEGRNAVYLARLGFHVTAVDYAEAGLEKTRRLAQTHGVEVETLHADVTSWQPEHTWDAVVSTFLHLPPEHRPSLYALMQRIVRPGGYVIAEWFRPEQRTEGYTSGGPPSPELMVTEDELRRYFPEEGLRYLHSMVRMLREGHGHHGPGAVVQLLWQKPA